jgi:hypothetical protein
MFNVDANGYIPIGLIILVIQNLPISHANFAHVCGEWFGIRKLWLVHKLSITLGNSKVALKALLFHMPKWWVVNSIYV